MTSLGTPQMLADLQGTPLYLLPSAELWKAVGRHEGLPTGSCCFSCLQQPAAKRRAAVLLQTFATGNWGGLQLGFAALPKTYKLLDLLIAISRLLSEVEGTACHSCCYLVFVIPLCTQLGIYATALSVWVLFWF